MLNITAKDAQELKAKFGQYFKTEVVKQPKEPSPMTHNIIIFPSKSNLNQKQRN